MGKTTWSKSELMALHRRSTSQHRGSKLRNLLSEDMTCIMWLDREQSQLELELDAMRKRVEWEVGIMHFCNVVTS